MILDSTTLATRPARRLRDKSVQSILSIVQSFSKKRMQLFRHAAFEDRDGEKDDNYLRQGYIVVALMQLLHDVLFGT